MSARTKSKLRQVLFACCLMAIGGLMFVCVTAPRAQNHGSMVLHQIILPSAGGGTPTEIVIDSIDMDATWLYEYDNTFNYGASATMSLGEGHAPTNREARILLRWPGYDDTVSTNHSAISEDSGKIGIVVENLTNYMAQNDTIVAVMHRVTTDWAEGTASGAWEANSSSWDTARTATAWTTAGGDFSATRETFGSYADSTFISRNIQSANDTVWFYVSGATMSAMATNNYGLLIRYFSYVDGGADGTILMAFYSDDDAGQNKRPIFKVYITE